MLKILHGPVNIGNQPWVLSRCERSLGAKSDLAVNYSTFFGFPSDLCLSPYADKAFKHRARRFLYSMTAPLRYDVLHYYFGRSFMCWDDYSPPTPWWFADLRLARRLGRKIFMTLQGCDSRISGESARRYAITPCHEGNCAVAPTCRASLDAERKRMIDTVLPLVDRVFVLNPELAHYVPGAVFMPYCNVDVEAFEPIYPKTEGPPVIIHAPTDEKIKGSKWILEALERLKQRIPMEVVLIKGLPHAEAMKLYARADLIIDQVLAGWYGGFAVEAMAMGKPVACYIRDEDLGFLPPRMREDLPLVRVTPETIERDLEAAILNRAQWPEWGRKAREYVLRWHRPRTIASAMLRAYADPDSRFNLEVET